ALILSLSFAAIADTVRQKDGSVIRGQVVGFKDQQFTVLIGSGARGRRSTVTLYMEDVESIEFDAATGTTTSISSNDDDDGSTMSGVTTPQSTPSSTQLPRPTASRPSSTQPSSGTQSSNNRPGSTGSTSRPPATTTRPSSTSATAPNYVPINARVRGDNSTNGWTNSGLVVRRGQRLRVNATGQVSLGNGRFSTPSGIGTLQDRDKLMQDEATGALIAVIGDDNNEFVFIGRTREFIAQRDGVLFLGVNEGNLNDNTGAYDVVIEADASGGSR
ncbi:MAG: hypothetical protein H7Y30_11260, partial [Pyrinomonadaceae bacterium]|nr:hypothetical protein [Pyrinomonadaceae bacterium]